MTYVLTITYQWEEMNDNYTFNINDAVILTDESEDFDYLRKRMDKVFPKWQLDDGALPEDWTDDDDFAQWCICPVIGHDACFLATIRPKR